jgi:RNA polymerase sigma-70 factor (ECF subfamily)
MDDTETLSHERTTAAALVSTIDERAFAELTRLYRRELHVHCYRMLASFEDAEDLVQETFLRAWQKRATYQGRAPFRAWLYRIATNACLDFLARHDRRVVELSAQREPLGKDVKVPHVEWLQPFPDRLLEIDSPGERDADAMVIRRETIELAYLVALQYLPPKQRVVLILRDVLEWSAQEVATLLDSSVASINAALQRARATLRRHQPARDDAPLPQALGDDEMQLVQQYADATERLDTETLTRLLRDDARFSMPPSPNVWVGNRAIIDAIVEGGFGQAPYDDFKCLITSANRMPAVANYLRKPGETQYRAFAIDVLRIEGGAVAEILAFDMSEMIGAFGLPSTIAPDAR